MEFLLLLLLFACLFSSSFAAQSARPSNDFLNLISCIVFFAVLLFVCYMVLYNQQLTTCSRCRRNLNPSEFHEGYKTCIDCQKSKKSSKNTSKQCFQSNTPTKIFPKPQSHSISQNKHQLHPNLFPNLFPLQDMPQKSPSQKSKSFQTFSLPKILVTTNFDLQQLLNYFLCPKCQEQQIEIIGFQEKENCQNISLGCKSCKVEFYWETSTKRFGESKTKKKHYLSHFILLNFLVSGLPYCKYGDVTKSTGLPSLSDHQFRNIIEKAEGVLDKILEDEMKNVREEIKARGDSSTWICATDGFYHIRGSNSDNASAALYDWKTGKVTFRTHRMRRGKKKNYNKTSKSMEGDMIEELFHQAKEQGFEISGCLLDGDASTHKALNDIFPQAEIVHCSNHSSKSFYSQIHQIYEARCSCKGCKRMTLGLLTKIQKTFQNLICNSKTNHSYFKKHIKNFPYHYSQDHSKCELHPLTINNSPYYSSLYFNCPVQFKLFQDYVEKVASQSDSYLSSLGDVTTNQAEGLHGLAIHYRDKTIALQSIHYKFKTDMAFIHRNVGPIWKFFFLDAMGLQIPDETLNYFLEEQEKFEIEREESKSEEYRRERHIAKKKRKEKRELYKINASLAWALEKIDHTYGPDSFEDLQEVELEEECEEVDDYSLEASTVANFSEFLVVLIDFESTGLDVVFDQIIQFAAIIPETSQIFNRKIKSNKKISPEAFKAHGISYEDIKDSPFFTSVFELFVHYIEANLKEVSKNKILLVAHNGFTFDFPILLSEIRRNKIQLNSLSVSLADSMLLMKKIKSLDPSLKFELNRGKIKLSSLYYTYFEEEYKEHDALGDCFALEKILFESEVHEHLKLFEIISYASFLEKLNDRLLVNAKATLLHQKFQGVLSLQMSKKWSQKNITLGVLTSTFHQAKDEKTFVESIRNLSGCQKSKAIELLYHLKSTFPDHDIQVTSPPPIPKELRKKAKSTSDENSPASKKRKLNEKVKTEEEEKETNQRKVDPSNVDSNSKSRRKSKASSTPTTTKKKEKETVKEMDEKKENQDIKEVPGSQLFFENLTIKFRESKQLRSLFLFPPLLNN